MNKPAYQCAVCNEWFEKMSELHKHEQEFHNPQENDVVSMQSAGGAFPCPQCGVETETAERLEEHLAQEHPTRSGMGKAPIQHSRGSKGRF